MAMLLEVRNKFIGADKTIVIIHICTREERMRRVRTVHNENNRVRSVLIGNASRNAIRMRMVRRMNLICRKEIARTRDRIRCAQIL